MYSVYIDGYKYYYKADKIELAYVTWTNDEVIQLTNPKECFEEDFFGEIDECGVQGEVFIPKNKITQIIYWTGNKKS